MHNYSLGFFYGLCLGEEDTVHQDRSHDDVVEVLVGGEEDAGAPDSVERREQEE